MFLFLPKLNIFFKNFYSSYYYFFFLFFFFYIKKNAYRAKDNKYYTDNAFIFNLSKEAKN